MTMPKSNGLLVAFHLFSTRANFEQKERMDVLRKELASLGRNPLANVSDRIEIGRRIVGLRAVVGATITSDMEY